MGKDFKQLLKQSKIYPSLRLIKSWLELFLWVFKNKQSVSPPALIKRKVLKAYARKFSSQVFVETGTYLGDTVEAMKNLFSEIHSIELGEGLAEEARKRFLRYPHIHIHQGDSASILPNLLENIPKPTLFWLDAHYSEGITVGDDEHLPLVSEIRTILSHWISGSVTLIDDARLMGQQKGYPSFGEIQKIVQDSNLGLDVKQELDIIRVC